jgi:hypothetical protein
VIEHLTRKHEALSSNPSTTQKQTKRTKHLNQAWWFVPGIPGLERLRWENCKFEFSVGFIESLRPGGPNGKILSQNQNQKQK